MSDESEHSGSEFYYPEELTDMELLQLPTDVEREDKKKSSAKLLTGDEVHNFIGSQQKGKRSRNTNEQCTKRCEIDCTVSGQNGQIGESFFFIL